MVGKICMLIVVGAHLLITPAQTCDLNPEDLSVIKISSLEISVSGQKCYSEITFAKSCFSNLHNNSLAITEHLDDYYDVLDLANAGLSPKQRRAAETANLSLSCDVGSDASRADLIKAVFKNPNNCSEMGRVTTLPNWGQLIKGLKNNDTPVSSDQSYGLSLAYEISAAKSLITCKASLLQENNEDND